MIQDLPLYGPLPVFAIAIALLVTKASVMILDCDGGLSTVPPRSMILSEFAAIRDTPRHLGQ